MFSRGFFFFLALILLTSCEEDITVDLDNPDPKFVVDGYIENGEVPYVFLSRNQPYFDPTSIDEYEKSFVHNAVIKVSDGTREITLKEICTDSLPPEAFPFLAEFLGLPLSNLESINYCLYTQDLIDQFTNPFTGKIGNLYSIRIEAEGTTLSSKTRIPEIVKLDSLWFDKPKPEDTLGFIGAHLTDPDTLGNAYRWFARRKGKDQRFIPPLGSAFNDKFINGKSFDFAYDRGHESEEEGQPASHYYTYGDTVIVKFTSIDLKHFQFWRSFETEAVNNGNPFAAPTTIQTNIKGGLGIWGGYGVSYDTLIINK